MRNTEKDTPIDIEQIEIKETEKYKFDDAFDELGGSWGVF